MVTSFGEDKHIGGLMYKDSSHKEIVFCFIAKIDTSELEFDDNIYIRFLEKT